MAESGEVPPRQGSGGDVEPPPPHGLRGRVQARLITSPRYRWVVLTAGLIGLFSVGFSITVLAVSVPTISAELNSPRLLITWVVTGPILAFAVFGPSAGKLADILGARRVYLWSLLAVGVFAALSAVAWSGLALVVFRVLGGAVGAAVGPSSLAMINRMFPPLERARALGFWAMVAAGGPVLGVVIGGPVVEAFSWRWIFVAQVPITMAALTYGWLVLPEVARRRGVRFDIPGSASLALAAASLLLGLNRGPEQGWSSPLVVACFVLAPMLLVAFVAIERSRRDPLLPLRYIRQRNFAFPVANQFSMNFAYMGGFIITPLLLQDVLGYGEAQAGFISIARPLAFTFAGPLAGYFAVKIGERSSGAIGAGAILVSLLGLATVGADTSAVFVVVVLAASGVGMGTAAPAMTAALANTVDEGDLGVSTAFQQMCNHIGTAVGTQLMLTVQAAQAPALSDPPTDAEIDTLATSYHWAYLVGATVALGGLIAALFVRRTRRSPSSDDQESAALTELEMIDAEVAPAGANP